MDEVKILSSVEIAEVDTVLESWMGVNAVPTTIFPLNIIIDHIIIILH